MVRGKKIFYGLVFFGLLLFAIVGQAGITVSWQPPTENEDGSPIDDLAGYYLCKGQIPYRTTRCKWVGNTTSYTYPTRVLIPGGWYWFWATAIDTSGNESEESNAVRIQNQ